MFWRAEPSRDPASATAASTSPSPFRDLSHSCRLEVPRPARSCPSPRRTSERLQHSHDAKERLQHSHDANRRLPKGLLAHFSRRWAGFRSRKPGYTQCKCESRCRAQRSPGVMHLHLDTAGLSCIEDAAALRCGAFVAFSCIVCTKCP